MRYLVIVSLWFVLLVQGCGGFPQPGPAAGPGDTLGVTISYNAQSTIFPDYWLKSPISAKVERLNKKEETRSKKAIARAIVKYPTGFLNKNLTAVYVVKSLNFYNVGFGATYYKENLYIANNGVEMGYSDVFIEQSFHHEFSSILYDKYKDDFNDKQWKAINPPGFTYNDEATGGVEALRTNKDDTDFSDYYNEQGFIDQYSQSSVENDINEIAQQLFCPSPGFWQRIAKYKRLERKTLLLIDFYHSIDSRFTYDYFKKFEVK